MTAPLQTIQDRQLTVSLNDDGAVTVTFAKADLTFTQAPSPYPVANSHIIDHTLFWDITANGLTVHCRLAADDDGILRMTLAADGPLTALLPYPAPWQPARGDTAILPCAEGVAYPVDDESIDTYVPHTFHPQMAFLGLLRQKHLLVTAALDSDDALLAIARNSDRLISAGFAWQPCRGQFGYMRSLTFFLAPSLCEAADTYRTLRSAHCGPVTTLREKTARNPHVSRLIGAADVWLWDDNNMNRLYARPEATDVTPRDPLRVADDMHARGMDTILWNAFEGEPPEVCAALKERGYLVGKYDIYRDVLPKPYADIAIPYRRDRSVNTRWWPDIVRLEANGDYGKAWQIHGKDGQMFYQHSVCDMCALRLTMENVPPDIQRIGYNSRLIDVQAGSTLQECYAPLHPCTRSDSLRYINTQNRFLADIGLVVGVEVGQEGAAAEFHYSEGLMSPPPFRAPDSGRRMCTQYSGDDIPEKITRYMLNPVYRFPLWELLYHDCTVSYWYWGDSSNSCPELMPLRDLFNALYGLPPLYSLNMTQWDQLKDDIAASYHRATPVAKLTGYAKMTDFQWLTADRLVQRTAFDNGVAVIVNFSNQAFTAEDGTVIAPRSAFVRNGDESFTITTDSNTTN